MSSAKGSLAVEYARLWAQSDTTPDVFVFLQNQPNTAIRSLADVLLLDQRLRWRAGVGRPVEEYLDRFPDVANDEALRLELITEELNYREQGGEQVSLDEFIQRFPELGSWGFSTLTRRQQQDELRSPTDLICELFARPEIADALLDGLSHSLALPGRRATEGTEEDVPLLARCEVFAALPRKVVRRIENHMAPAHFAEGDLLLQQNTPGASLLVVTDGVVEIVTEDDEGRRHLISRAGRGHVLGEMSLLSDEPRSADAVARTTVEALVLPADTFHQLARQHPQISIVLTNLVASRLGGLTRDVLADKMLSGYRIKRRLGRGGMAVVYEATDTRTDAQVALKMMSHRLVYDTESLKRFQREADIIELFDHPNICRMFGRFAAFHTYFIVMEYCDGVTADELLQRRGSLPAGEIKKILGQVGAALANAHEAGIAHRDIKPSNVMILRDGTVKLMDFGLAAPLADDATDSDGTLVGTPRYMAPEQLLGNRAGRQADYFALGALAYELFNARPLFPTNDLAELLGRHSGWQPESFAEVCAQASAEVSEVLRSALAKHADERHVDLQEMAAWAAPVDTELLHIARNG